MVWLVVGLGNPGPAFASHLHNVGYRVADELARRLGVRFRALRGCRAEVAEGEVAEATDAAPAKKKLPTATAAAISPAARANGRP